MQSVKWFLEDPIFSGRMIGSSPTTFPLSPVSKLSFFSVFLHVSPVELTVLTGERGGGVAEEPIIRPRGSLALYKSFNTLCPNVFQFL
jgi:hypothetical protein